MSISPEDLEKMKKIFELEDQLLEKINDLNRLQKKGEESPDLLKELEQEEMEVPLKEVAISDSGSTV